MASDFSRITFNPKKHYRGVLMQQGRVQLDADWNEQLALRQYRTHTETKDVIGQSGVPKKGDAFKITPFADGSDLLINAGHMYVGGLLCELENILPATSYFNQPYYPNPDNTHFQNNLGSPPLSPPSSPPLSPPTFQVPGLLDGAYLIYIDAWQREVNYLDDPLIREVALNEADTTTRLQNVWQVKLLAVKNTNGDCQTVFPEWQQLISPPSGTLNVQTVELEGNENPCVLPPTSGYQRLENQLYRVEIQKGGTSAEATFKWSRENASIETIIEGIDGNKVIVESIGKDEVLGFANGQWVEIVDEVSSLNGVPRQLVQITLVDPAKREITLDTAGISNPNNSVLKLRRWDQSTSSAEADGIPMTDSWLDLEGGIQVQFSEGSYRAGDYWLIPARTATGEVEWPPYEIPNLHPQPQAPKGIQHQYCKLALLIVQNGVITVEDCRPLFPSLTEICADDICYQSENCDLRATTVQEAIDELCQRGGRGCTYHVSPGPGWEAVFDLIEPGRDAEICFEVGNYPLNNTVQIQRKGHLKITGGGLGTRIMANNSEAALRFENCSSITIRDLYAQTGKIGTRKNDLTEHLNGTLTFRDCGRVQLNSIALRCGSGAIRAATCITVRNDSPGAGIVRIQNSDLSIGYRQQGILLVNVREALIENNSLTTYQKSARLNLGRLVANKKYRANLKGRLLSNTKFGPRSTSSGSTNTTLSFGNTSISFNTPTGLRREWEQILRENPPVRAANNNDLYNHVLSLADRILVDEVFRNRYSQMKAFFDRSAAQDPAVASQGITIGGRGANDIRILNNSLSSVLQGIHVGLSNRNDNNEPYLSGMLTIAGNTIEVVLPATIHRLERYGIFVGNCRSLIVENNNISLSRLPDASRLEVEGIRVWGVLGNRLMITKNYIADKNGNQKNSFNIGIRVRPLNNINSISQWVVSWNVAPSKRSTLSLDNGVMGEHNTP